MLDVSSPTQAASPTPLANIGAMDLGTNVLTIDLTPTGQSSLAAIFAYTNDAVTPDTRYCYPRQMTLTEVNNTALSVLSATIQSAYDMQRSIGGAISGSGDFEGFNFSGSASYQYSETVTHNFETVVYESSSMVQLWQLSVNANERLPLSAAFVKQISALPPTYTGNEAAYAAVVASFGTHYVSAATFGGRTYQQTTTSSESSSKLVQQGFDASAQAGVAMLASLGMSANTHTAAYEAFSETASVGELQWLGGTASMDWGTWVASVPQSPAIVGATLVPIYELLTAEYFPDVADIEQVQAGLTAAVNAYITSQGTDPSVEGIPFGPYYGAPSPTHPGVVLSPLASSGKYLTVTVGDHDKLSLSIKSPGSKSSTDLLIPIDRIDPSAAGPIMTGGWVGLAVPGITDGGFMFVQADNGKVDAVAMQNVEPTGAWAFVNPLNPQAGPSLVFPGSMVQLYNDGAQEYLRANGSSPATTGNALDPTTYWIVTIQQSL
jgi:hypothetical protein